MENPGIDPGASRMRTGRSTNELIPQKFAASLTGNRTPIPRVKTWYPNR